MNQVFADFDFENFWDNSNELSNEFVGKPLTDEMVEKAEKFLGYSLPNSYIELLRNQNGGMTKEFQLAYNDAGIDKCLLIDYIVGIDGDIQQNLCDDFLRKKFDIYEKYIIPFALSDKGVIAFDYENCVNNNPYIVLVRINRNDDIKHFATFNSEIFLVVNFEEFIKGLNFGE